MLVLVKAMDESELQQSLELYRAQVTRERYTGLVDELSFFFNRLTAVLSLPLYQASEPADAEPVLRYS